MLIREVHGEIKKGEKAIKLDVWAAPQSSQRKNFYTRTIKIFMENRQKRITMK